MEVGAQRRLSLVCQLDSRGPAVHRPPPRMRRMVAGSSPLPALLSAHMASLDRTLLSVAVIALGLALGGFAVGNVFVRDRAADRFVTVKGVAEREARAREAAVQFARDSDSEPAEIRQANQAVFEILPRDQAPGISEESQIAKVVRVVSTIDYYLR